MAARGRPGAAIRPWQDARMATASPRAPRLQTVLREKASVTPLELFFDLVFVLAMTQCTALMADEPTWRGVAKGMLVLGVLWWSWVGYAWLTSVIDPEEGVIRIAIFAPMAALPVVSPASRALRRLRAAVRRRVRGRADRAHRALLRRRP